jgi:hypothetical protein
VGSVESPVAVATPTWTIHATLAAVETFLAWNEAQNSDSPEA